MNNEKPNYRALDIDTIGDLQYKHSGWCFYNFGEQKSWTSLLGVVEEVGELAHAHLKREQGIRGDNDEHRKNQIDSVCDIIIFLMNYCNLESIHLGAELPAILNNVWLRDWKKYPKTGFPDVPYEKND